MINVDPNKVAEVRKRSSLKQKSLFPEGMSYEDYMLQKSKTLKWDAQVEGEVKEECTTIKYKDSQTHFEDLVRFSFNIEGFERRYLSPQITRN